jgi:hypothetical protein
MDFERIFQFFKTHKNLYTGLLCISDPQYGGTGLRNTEFLSVLPQTSDFW